MRAASDRGYTVYVVGNEVALDQWLHVWLHV